MNSKIPFIKPTFPTGSEVLKDYETIHENNYYTNNGDFYYRFVESIEKYLDNKAHASVLSNATAALILSIDQLFDHSKKYVLVPSFTFAAAPLAIKWNGFEPIFIDINDSAQPSYEQADEFLKKDLHQVAGVLLCNSFGIGNLEISQWENLCDEYELSLIIDSAAGFGSFYSENERLGARGDCHATKPFGIGEGGSITSKDTNFIEKIESLKNFGFDSTRMVTELGFNAKIPEINCAIGLRSLNDLDSRLDARKQILIQYKAALEKFDISFIANDNLSSLCFASLILPDKWDKEKILELYAKEMIEVREYYNPAVHLHPYFSNTKTLDMNKTNETCKKILSLPMSERLSANEIERIVKVIDEYASTI